MYLYENMETVLEHIEKNKSRFNMNFYVEDFPDCGTVACLAGWTCILLDQNYSPESELSSPRYYERTAHKLLGLGDDELNIFNGCNKCTYVNNSLSLF